jgi:hypothetical protein
MTGARLVAGALLGAACSSPTDANRISLQASHGKNNQDLIAMARYGAVKKKGVSFLQTKVKARTGLMHATQYYGSVEVGGQPFTVIFDSGMIILEEDEGDEIGMKAIV